MIFRVWITWNFTGFLHHTATVWKCFIACVASRAKISDCALFHFELRIGCGIVSRVKNVRNESEKAPPALCSVRQVIHRLALALVFPLFSCSAALVQYCALQGVRFLRFLCLDASDRRNATPRQLFPSRPLPSIDRVSLSGAIYHLYITSSCRMPQHFTGKRRIWRHYAISWGVRRDRLWGRRLKWTSAYTTSRVSLPSIWSIDFQDDNSMELHHLTLSLCHHHSIL